MAPSTKTNETGSKCMTRRRWIIFFVVFSILVIAGALAFYFVFYKKDAPDPVATCGDCHCIPDEKSNATCPLKSPRIYSQNFFDNLKSQTPLNGYELNCNPFPDGDDCQTDPPQELTELGDEAVCGIHYAESSDANCPTDYHLKTYPSWDDAEAAGAFVTHVGSCGVCSTTQDLAAYIASPDLTTEGKFCSKQALLSLELGLDCYLELGFTEQCAFIWAYNGLNTAQACLGRCATRLDEPNNGPPPQCTLSDCLACDEEISGPIFQQYAGRTRRRSGLLTAIARPCGAIVPIVQDACPDTIALDGEWL